MSRALRSVDQRQRYEFPKRFLVGRDCKSHSQEMMNNLKSLFARSFFSGLLIALIVQANLSAAAETSLARDANVGWRFIRGEHVGAEALGFDDSAWRVLDLPHDWSIETERKTDAATGPHDPTTPEGPSVGYLRGGIGW